MSSTQTKTPLPIQKYYPINISNDIAYQQLFPIVLLSVIPTWSLGRNGMTQKPNIQSLLEQIKYHQKNHFQSIVLISTYPVAIAYPERHRVSNLLFHIVDIIPKQPVEVAMGFSQ